MTAPLIEALKHLGAGFDLSEDETHAAFLELMEGTASEALVAALLTAVRVKGETAEELAGAVRAVRDRMIAFEPMDRSRPLLDTCGTGGDGANTVNISTATAIVAAARGVAVAKHGNRSASGNSGSAEVLTALGVAVEASPEVLRRCLDRLGIAFFFAPSFHPALRFVGPVRRQLPFRTLFNLIGPLVNPARPDAQLVGVPNLRQAELMAAALSRLGVRRAAVVTGSDGLDEVTLAGPTQVRWIEGDSVTHLTWRPEDFGLPEVPATVLRVSGPAESADRLRAVFRGEPGPDRSLVLANSAAALWVAGAAADLHAGALQAAEALDSGSAGRLLDRWARFSQGEE